MKVSNKKILSGFRSTTPEFEKFTKDRFWFLDKHGFTVYLNNEKYKTSSGFFHKIYKKLAESGADYLVSASFDNCRFYFCKKSQYKQLLFNLRNKTLKLNKKNMRIKLSQYEPLGKNAIEVHKKEIKRRLHRMQLDKLNLHKRFSISIYDFNENKMVYSFRPFVKIENSPKKSSLAVKLPLDSQWK